jgi:hypothetical protein
MVFLLYIVGYTWIAFCSSPYTVVVPLYYNCGCDGRASIDLADTAISGA